MKPNHEISRGPPNEPQGGKPVGLHTFETPSRGLAEKTREGTPEPWSPKRSSTNKAQVAPWADTAPPLGVRGFGSGMPEKRLGSTISKLLLEDVQNRGPAEGGRGRKPRPGHKGLTLRPRSTD